VPEAKGGFGLRVDVATAAAAEFGAALHGSPYAGLTASAHALAHADDPLADDLLAAVLAGERVCAFGRLDPGDGSGESHGAGPGGSSGGSSGGRAARLVDGAVDADTLLLVDQDRLLLFTDPADWRADTAPHGFDVSRTCADVTVDSERGHPLALCGHPVELYGLLLAADAIGCVRRTLDRTVAYAGQRRAFGRPIGGFQAVQHRFVDHAVRSRGMGLLVTEAARLLGAGAPGARRAVALAGASVSSGATRILHDLLQLIGAIGFTWEYGLHFHTRRVHQDARLAAGPRAAVRTLADLEGWIDAR